MKPSSPIAVARIIAMALAFLFIYTATSKLMGRERFEQVIGQSSLLSGRAFFYSYTIPIVELIVSSLLLTSLLRLYGFIASATMMTAFTGYIVWMLRYEPHRPCSCGGMIEKLSWGQHLVLNILLIILSATGALLLYKRPKFLLQ